MKANATTTILTLLFGFALAAPLQAANHVVELGLGQVIQAKVALAQTGDVVIIREQTYVNQTVTVNKRIRFVREKDANVTIGGALAFEDVNGTMVLRDFTLEADGNGSLKIENCTKFGLENLTKLPHGITITGSNVVMRDCAFTGNLTISGGGTVEIIDTTLAGDFTVTDAATTVLLSGSTISGEASFSNCNWQAHDTTFEKNLVANQCHSKLFRSIVQKAFTHGHAAHGGANLDCIIFQSTIGRQSGHLLHSKAHRTWVAYSTIHHAVQEGGAEAHFIGNQVYVDKARGNNGITLVGASCEATIANNHFYNGNTSTTLVIATNNTQVKTAYNSDGTNWKVKKTFNLYNTFVTEVRNEIKNEHSSSSYFAESRMRFFYADGSTAYSSSYSASSGSFIPRVYANPNPNKLVTKIEVWLKSNDNRSNREALERNTTVRGSAQGVNIVNAKKVRLLNNLFRNWDRYGHCVAAVMAPADGLFIRGNAFWRSDGYTWQKHAVYAQQGVERYVFNTSGLSVADPDVCAYNYFHNNSKGVTGGIANNNNNITGDPKFVNNSNDWSLQASSPLKDKGPVDAEYKDHDGSRNDVGLHGGHVHDPNGTTSTVPVIISADQSALRIRKGGPPLLIKARAAVSTP